MSHSRICHSHQIGTGHRRTSAQWHGQRGKAPCVGGGLANLDS